MRGGGWAREGKGERVGGIKEGRQVGGIQGQMDTYTERKTGRKK